MSASCLVRVLTTARSLVGPLALTMVLGWGPCAAHAVPLFLPLGDLAGGSFSSSANAISGDGNTVVGASTSASGSEAVVWTFAQGMQGLGDLPGGSFASVANDVSADGSVVVGASQGATGSQAFRWNQTDGLVALGSGAAIATAITRDGMMIVGRTSASSAGGGFRWTDSLGIQLMGSGTTSNVAPGFPTDVTSNGSTVVGYTINLSNCPGGAGETWVACGWQWRSNTGFRHDMPMGQVNAVSSTGSVLVGTQMIRVSVSDFETAALWSLGGGLVGIGALPQTFNSAALDVSADGQTVVGFSTDFNVSKAFIWDPVNGLRDLQLVLTELGVDLTGWSLTSATSISDDGLTIAGNGINPSGMQEAWLARIVAVPEPGTILLLGVGVALITPRRRPLTATPTRPTDSGAGCRP